MAKLIEIRILPPLGVARLGSSPEPMDNYTLELPDGVGPRRITAAETLMVDRNTGDVARKTPPFSVAFRDAQRRIRPIAPFFEVWARFDDDDQHLVPLTKDHLENLDPKLNGLEWSVTVGNIKAFRRTGDVADKVTAQTGPFSDHGVHDLFGKCENFLDDKRIHLGSVQFVKPSKDLPEIRLRFTPAAGRVYGPALEDGNPDPIVHETVYDRKKGKWPGYSDDAFDPQKDPVNARKVTNPGDIYAGETKNGKWVSWGYLDDECDGTIQVSLKTSEGNFETFGRIAAGPPTFAPDRYPVRTIHDELEQALLGPEPDALVTEKEFYEVKEIVRRALESVQMMNTGYLNLGSAGMARMDNLDYNRVIEPIADPRVTDSLAIRARHERILVSMEGEAIVWFARFLRDYDEVGDLSNEARQKMPAMMRNADGRLLTLTRRQLNKVRRLSETILSGITPRKEKS